MASEAAPTDNDREIANQLLNDFCDGGMDYDQFRFAIAEAIANARCGRALDAAAAVDGDAGWNAAIEEAAKVADDEDQNIAHAGQHNNWVMRQDALKECAAAIRSLKRLK